MRIDEAGQDDLAAGVDLAGSAGVDVPPDGEDSLAFDQHVGLDEVAHLRVHRHDVAAANDIAPPRLAAILRRTIGLERCSRRHSKQIQARRADGGRGRGLQEIAPPELERVWPRAAPL